MGTKVANILINKSFLTVSSTLGIELNLTKDIKNIKIKNWVFTFRTLFL